MGAVHLHGHLSAAGADGRKLHIQLPYRPVQRIAPDMELHTPLTARPRPGTQPVMRGDIELQHVTVRPPAAAGNHLRGGEGLEGDDARLGNGQRVIDNPAVGHHKRIGHDGHEVVGTAEGMAGDRHAVTGQTSEIEPHIGSRGACRQKEHGGSSR